MTDIPISYPGKYAPGMAVAFANPAGFAQQVSASSPLPVIMASASAGVGVPVALAGTTSVAGIAGPFPAVPERPLVLSLSGSWTGTVTVLRSIDGGATKLPLTLAGATWGMYSGNVCEPIWEEQEAAATFYLQLAPTTGAVTYRLAQ